MDRRSALRDINGDALRVAGAMLVLHFASLAMLLGPAWSHLASSVRTEFATIGRHLLIFNLELAVAVALLGAVAGFATGCIFTLLGHSGPRRNRVAAALGILGLIALIQVAHRPALFEDLLWRRGGPLASFEVFLVEHIGARPLQAALWLIVGGLCLAIAVRHRHTLRRRARATALAIALGIVLFGYFSGVYRPAAHNGDRPSIIVLAADSLRPDRFSSEGNPHLTTPFFDEWRKQARWFDHVFVPIASTTASWTTYLTGVYPQRHGVRDLFPREEQVNPQLPTLPKVLGDNGYETAVVSDYAGETFNRMRLGFDVVDAPPATSLEVIAEREVFERAPLALAFLSGTLGEHFFPVAEYLPVNADPDALTDRVEEQLNRLESNGKPFFLVVFYSVTHAPFAPPMPDATAFTSPGYAGRSRYSYELQQLSDLARASERPSDADVSQIRALYDGSLHAFDRQAKRIVDRLDRDGLKNRIVLVTGDHGENLFEPGTTTEHGKWFEGGDAANRTLLGIQAPNLQPGTVSDVVSGVDFMPTVLALAGITCPAGIDGQSLLEPLSPDRTIFAETGIWLGGKADDPPGTIAYPPLLSLLKVEPDSHALVLKRSYADITVTAKLRAARHGPWELIYTPGPAGVNYKLYNIDSDPYFQSDLSSAHPEILGRMRRDLLAWLSRDPLRWLNAKDEVVRRVEQ